VLFPKILQLRPSRVESTLDRVLSRNLSEQPQFKKHSGRLPQLAKPCPRIYELEIGNIDGWKDDEENDELHS